MLRFDVSVYHHDFTSVDVVFGRRPAAVEELMFVTTSWFETTPSAEGIEAGLEELFELFNRDEMTSVFGGDVSDDPRIVAYRLRGLRSLSVGDVIVIHTEDGDLAYDCKVIGWHRRKLEVPTQSHTSQALAGSVLQNAL